MVEQMGMNGFYGKLVASLSMGQKQRVMVARTLLHDPSVIIFDEATVGLDVMASKILVETVKLCRQKSKTVIFSTHIMGEVSRLADDVTVLHQGRVLFNGEFEMFRNRCGENIEEGFVNLLESGGRA